MALLLVGCGRIGFEQIGRVDGGHVSGTDAGICAGLPCDGDADGDGLLNGEEAFGTRTTFVTDPMRADTDGDGVDDRLDPAPTVAACSTELLFHDPFAAAPSAWTAVSETFVHDPVEGTYEVSGAIASQALTWLDMPVSWSDYVVVVRVRADQPQLDVGFIARVQSVSAMNNYGSYYTVGIYPRDPPARGSVSLGSMNDDGTWHPLQSADVSPPGQWGPGEFHTLELRATGPRLQVFVDGAATLDQNDSRYASGSIGLRTYQTPASYDDVVVCR